jgi:transmembrane sensor
MSASSERVRELITEQAADWFVANRAGVTVQERAEFAAWLKASPAHVEEYLGVATVSRDLRAACDTPENSIEQIVARARSESGAAAQPFWPRTATSVSAPFAPWWQRTAVTVAALAVVSFALFASRSHWLPVVQTPTEVAALHFETRHGEQQTVVLADNSVLHLNTDSAATVRYSPSERTVTLSAGEALVEVVHEPARPFRVLAGAAEIVDVGTQFDVRLENDATLVTVVEGRVTVGLRSNQGAPLQAVELGANQQVDVTEAGWPVAPMLIDAQRTTAWLHRQIAFEHEPMSRVAQEFNRYSDKPIEIVSPSLQNLEISGVFATDDPAAFIAFLRSLEGVRVEVTPTSIRVLRR